MFRKMFGRSISLRRTFRLHTYITLIFCFPSSLLIQPALGQSKSAAAISSLPQEFPVIMRQNVVAGATRVGTKVEAKLALATLVNGVVVPENAILTGEVTESAAKSATSPSRLAIRLDSAQWKNHSAAKTLSFEPKIYLSAWYYPPSIVDLAAGLPDAGPSPRFGGTAGAYPGQRNPTGPRNVGGDDPTSPPPDTSPRRTAMKDVESTRDSGGAVVLSSTHSNIKLDKMTTYVFAAGEPGSGPG